jgi:3-phosphoglycerate kinase
MFTKKTVRDIDLQGKTVLLRADYNVPVTDKGDITDGYRITQSLQTIKYLQSQKCKIVICSHLGRPKNSRDSSCSLRPVAKKLQSLLKTPVAFTEDCIGEKAEDAVKKLNQGDILLLENLRFHPEEEKNDANFAKQLASLADVFVQDGFGVVHRSHASTDAITRYLPSVAGLLLAQEVDVITNAMVKPERPLMAVIGGAKIADKIGVLNRFIDIADVLVVGGAMANTFLLAKGIPIGKSMAESDDIHLAKDIMKRAQAAAKQRNFVFYLPQDGVVAKNIDTKTTTRIVDWDAHVIADIEDYPRQPSLHSSRVEDSEHILDIGPFSSAFISGAMQLCKTVIWNGSLGVTEIPAVHNPIGPFSHGTDQLVDSMLGSHGNRPFSIVGGGDTVGYIENRNLTDSFNHISTGGGASLELMSGKRLPGVEALLNK